MVGGGLQERDVLVCESLSNSIEDQQLMEYWSFIDKLVIWLVKS